MDENTQTPNNQSERHQPETAKGDKNSAASVAPAADAETGAQYASSYTSAPPESGTETSAEAKPSQASEGEAKPKTSKKKKAGSRAAKKKNASRDKSKRPRKGAKAESAEEAATEEQGGAGAAGNATSLDTDEPMAVYLRGCSLEPAPAPPAGTLPPQLDVLFSDMLSVATALAVTAAAVGQNVQARTHKEYGSSSLALRVASVGEERRLPQAVAPVLEAAYNLERQDVLRWSEDKERRDLLNAAGVAQRRLYQQTLTNAQLLGLAELRDGLNPTITASSCALPRPRFVLRDPVQSDVARAFAAAGSGILLVDGRRQPTMAGFGTNYDSATAAMLNSAAAGNALELADPQLAGGIRMRPLSVSVIGTLSNIDVFSLHKAGSAALAATVFVPAEDGSQSEPATGAVGTLTEILGRVRALAAASQDSGSPLQFSAAARKALQQAEIKLSRMSTEVLAPLADYYDTVPDLMRRITIILYLLDQADRQTESMSTEIGKGVVARAVALIEQSVLPAARNILAAGSVGSDLRNGRRLLSYAQQYCSHDYPTLVRRDLIRIFQRSMPVPAVDWAIARLVKDGLLIASKPDAAKIPGQFQIDPVVFDPKNQLPDLVTDPRRPRL